MKKTIDVLGVGNAIVDCLSVVSDSELESMRLSKGMMTLIDDEQCRRLNSSVHPETVRSGGSVANSIALLSSLGSKCKFIGKVALDDAGDQFADGMAQGGIVFETARERLNASTGQCFIFVTADAQRTMCTHLGASTMLTLDDVDANAVVASSYLFVEGYLWDSPSARQMVLEQSKIACVNNTPVAFSLSDPLLVDRHRSQLQDYVEQFVDVLFANEAEAAMLYRSRDFDSSIIDLCDKVSTCVVTRGAAGSVAVCDNHTYVREADPVKQLKDTTGAGDAYAGGFLQGLTQHMSIEQCMSLASASAASVIDHIGGR